jgi:hypothetical protein
MPCLRLPSWFVQRQENRRKAFETFDIKFSAQVEFFWSGERKKSDAIDEQVVDCGLSVSPSRSIMSSDRFPITNSLNHFHLRSKIPIYIATFKSAQELSKNYFCLQLFSSGNKIDVQIKFDFIVDPVFCISSRTHKTPSFNMTTLELPADSNRTAGTTCALLAPLCMVIVETLSYGGCVMRCTE